MKRLTLLILLLLPPCVFAQEPTTTTTTAETTTAADTTTATDDKAPTVYVRSEEVRNQFTSLLSDSPSELATIIALDPTLLSDEAFLARYPELAKYVAAHPEVRHNPRYYLANFRVPGDGSGMLSELVQNFVILCCFIVIALAFAWLVRTLIEQNRWSRLAHTQSEVHKKLLERFGTSAELLEYMGTPAGSKFLESAPIPLHSEAPRNGSLSRVLWSIQIGVVVAAGAIGTLIVSGRYSGETAQSLFALGVIALCIGVGFVGSAMLSMFLSRRLTATDAA